MKRNRLQILVSFLLLGLTVLPHEKTFGQGTSKSINEKGSVNAVKNSPREYSDSHAILVHSRVLNILNETANDAKSWDDAKTAAQVQARIADIVWDFDALSAETYLKQAWEKSKDVKESVGKVSQFRNSSPRVEASSEVLRVARKRAPALAEKWFAELTDLTEEDFKKRNNGVFDDRTAKSAVLLQLAIQSAKENPQAAAAFATESLRDGISYGLQNVLIAIQEKNPELAQNVFRAALQKVQTAGIQDPAEILILYSYVYTPGQVFAASSSANPGQSTVAVAQNRPQIKAMAELNPGLALEFLRVSTNALLRLPYPADEDNARKQTSAINTILSRTGSSLPQESQALRERLTTILASTNYSPDSISEGVVPRQRGEKVEDYFSRVIDNLVEKAEKESNPMRRDILYAQTALKTTAEMFERGKFIAGKIQDKELREQVINLVIYRKTLDEIKLDNLDSAYKILSKNSNSKQKAASLIVGANKLKKGKDTVQLNYWLSDAEKLFRKAEKSDVDWIKIGFGLTKAYAEVNKIESSDIFGKTAKLFDEKTKVEIGDDDAPLASGFSGIEFINFLNSTQGFSLKTAISTFSRDDFEDALSSLQAMKNPKTKGFGILALSEKYLIDSQKHFREIERKALK